MSEITWVGDKCDSKTINFTKEAIAVLAAQEEQCRQVASFYGGNSSEYLKMANSMLWCLTTVIRLGGNIWADGELDLVGNAEFLTYGMNFHNGNPYDHHENPDTVTNGPTYGTWSINS